MGGVMAFCADFDSISTFTVQRKRFWEKQTSCPICLDKFAAGDVANKLPCGHTAHVACMEQWFATDRTCPSCQAPIEIQPTEDDCFVLIPPSSVSVTSTS